MAKQRILYVSPEIAPYLPASEIAQLGRDLPVAMHGKKYEVRTFMPNFGNVNERRNQLHEVIRLSGINIPIKDADHPLIIKVASMQPSRIQVYFIDNDDYFSRKAILHDAEGREFADNDERAIFFARGVLETVKKLRWTPDVVHCHGWFSAIVPIYLRKVFYDDPVFRDVKIVLSLPDDRFEGTLSEDMRSKIEGEGIADENLEILDTPSYENLYRFVIDYADGVIATSNAADPALLEYARSKGKRVLEFASPEQAETFDNYKRFYEEL